MADSDEVVLIEHPDLPDTKENPPTVRRSSLEEVWRERGWRLHKAPKTAAKPTKGNS